MIDQSAMSARHVAAQGTLPEQLQQWVFPLEPLHIVIGSLQTLSLIRIHGPSIQLLFAKIQRHLLLSKKE